MSVLSILKRFAYQIYLKGWQHKRDRGHRQPRQVFDEWWDTRWESNEEKQIVDGMNVAERAQNIPTQRLRVDDIVKIPHYNTMPGQYRMWRVTGVYLGAVGYEDWYELVPVKYIVDETIRVPCILIHKNPNIEVIRAYQQQHIQSLSS